MYPLGEKMFFQKHRAIVFIEEGKQQEVFSVCDDIRKKDKSFDFTPLTKSLILYDKDKDKLHKRALWLVKNVKGIRGYMVL
jgi:hypothetical protein